MAKTKEEILAEMKKAQAKQREVREHTGRAPRGGEAQPIEEKQSKEEKKQEPVSDDVRIKQLEERLQALKRDKADLKDQVENKEQVSNYQKEQEALSSVIQNNDDYHFVKKYTVSTAKGQKREFVVKMHAPSVMEQAEIQQEFVDLTSGRGAGFLAGLQDLYLAIGYFRVVGDNVPNWFTDVDKTYRVDILLDVFRDYEEWLDFFLQDQLQ